MMCTWWFKSFAFTTPALPTTHIVVFHLLMVCWFPILWYGPWIYGAGSIVADPNAYREDIDPPYLILSER